MANRMTVKHRGGKKLDRLLRTAMKGGVKNVQVGFFSSARYDDKKNTPVAAVAAWNEFGTKTIPERPFFRQALSAVVPDVEQILKNGIDPQKMVVDPQLADVIGLRVATEVQESITRLKEPKNAPSTIARKGSSNPLIDTGHMRNSATWRVTR